MAEAKRRDEWDHTAMICATIANAMRGKKGAHYDPADFHPMHWKPIPHRKPRDLVIHMRDAFKQLRGRRQ